MTIRITSVGLVSMFLVGVSGAPGPALVALADWALSGAWLLH
jgi:hypothetical protein